MCISTSARGKSEACANWKTVERKGEKEKEEEK